MSFFNRINPPVQHILDFIFGAKQIGIICNKDLAAVRTAAFCLYIHIRSAHSIGHKRCSHIQSKSHTASFPVSHRKPPHGFLYGARIAGQISILIKSSRIGKLLSRQTINSQLSISVQTHSHIKDKRAILPWNRHTERVVSHTALIASPQWHTAFRINPAHTHKACFSHFPYIGCASHPMSSVFQGNTANPMFFRQLYSSVSTKERIGNANPQLSVIIFHCALCTCKLRLAFNVNPSLLNIFHKSGNSIQSMAFYPISTGLNMNSCTYLSLFFCKSQIQENLLYILL